MCILFVIYMLLIFILTHYYLIAKWLTISSCCVVFVFQSLLRSPEVISFLQQQQRLLTTQNRAQTQHNYWRLKTFYSSCRRLNAETFNATFLQQQYSILMWEPWASVTYSHPWWSGDYQHCILKTGIFDKDLIDLKYCCRHQALWDHEMK